MDKYRYPHVKTSLVSVVLAFMAMMLPMTVYAQSEKACVGVFAGYISKNKSGIAGVFGQVRLAEQLRLAPDLAFVIRHDNRDALAVNVNAHMPLVVGQAASLYPLAGINYTAWSTHDTLIGAPGSVCVRESRVGLNLGAGFDVKISSNLKAKIEWKYTITTKYSTMVLDAGVGYTF